MYQNSIPSSRKGIKGPGSRNVSRKGCIAPESRLPFFRKKPTPLHLTEKVLLTPPLPSPNNMSKNIKKIEGDFQQGANKYLRMEKPQGGQPSAQPAGRQRS